jgi:L-rhamnose-H+ transport protein
MVLPFFAGLLVIAASAVSNSSFPLPLKKTRHWKWENAWLLFSIWSLAVMPPMLAAALAPGFTAIYAAVPFRTLLPALAGGFLWGTAQVTFGIGIDMVGMAMAFAIVGGLCAFTGSVLVLAVLAPGEMLGARGLTLLAGTVVLGWGLARYARAARERDVKAGGGAGRSGSVFRKGLAVSVYTGIMGGALNMGFANSGELVKTAVETGVSAGRATLPVWALLLGAAAIPNAGYSLWLLWRNRTFRVFPQEGGRNLVLTIAMAALWLAGTIGYGFGATIMGAFGTSVGYALYLTLLVLWSSVMGVLTGEWKGASPATIRTMKQALGIIVAAVVIFSSAGLL